MYRTGQGPRAGYFIKCDQSPGFIIRNSPTSDVAQLISLYITHRYKCLHTQRFMLLQSNSMKDSRPDNQEIPRFLRNPKVYWRVQKNPPLTATISKPNSVNPITFVKIHINTILVPTPRSSKWPMPFKIAVQNSAPIYFLTLRTRYEKFPAFWWLAGHEFIHKFKWFQCHSNLLNNLLNYTSFSKQLHVCQHFSLAMPVISEMLFWVGGGGGR
jgi:hypothetical protein